MRMPILKPSSRLGLFALLLSVIVLSLVGSLVAADRALSAADRQAVELDAQNAALIVDRAIRGTGTLVPSEIVAALGDSTEARPWLALTRRGQPVAVVGSLPRSGSVLRAAAPVRAGTDSLVVEVAHTESGGTLRQALWMLGTIAMLALFVGLARERRQATHLAARTSEL